MFEHLDDPDAFVPDDRFRTAVARRGRSRRRNAWLARGGVAAVLVVVAAAGASAALVDHQLAQVDRVRVAGLAPEPAAAADPYTVLFVGTDSDAGLRADDPVRSGREQVDGLRSDTVMVARVDPAADRITVLPLPRDLWVDVPGHGANRINAAIGAGGPTLLVRTVQQELGVAINRYVQVDFQGAIDIGDTVGGLRLSFPTALRDLSSGFHAEAGCQVLDGRAVLALARSRHAQYLDAAGRWRIDPTSDLGRIERQQALATALLGSLSHVDTTSPRQLGGLLDAIASDLTVDSHVDRHALVGLFRDLAGSRIEQLRLPVVDAVHGGADVLELGPGADGVLARFRAAATPPASTTTVPAGVEPTEPTTTTAGVSPAPSAPISTPVEAIPTPC